MSFMDRYEAKQQAIKDATIILNDMYSKGKGYIEIMSFIDSKISLNVFDKASVMDIMASKYNELERNK